MKKQLFIFLLGLVTVLFSTMGCSVEAIRHALQNSEQLVLVLSKDWHSSRGQLLCYERRARNQSWHLVSRHPIDAAIGKNGMAWGVEWERQRSGQSNRIKKEGDGCSPAGVYFIGSAFGFAPHAHDFIPAMKWAYLPLKTTSICVDDPVSPYYNQLIDSNIVPHWNPQTSGEHMLKKIPQYTWGSVIQYNNTHQKGAGSCIFIHVWRDALHGTAGCVAMEQQEIIQMLRWLDPSKAPVIALFPRDVYQHKQRAWGLPWVT